MSVFSIIPIKRLVKSKTRLSYILTHQERQDFSLAMLEDVLEAVKNSNIDHSIVVSSDQRIKVIAKNYEAFYLQECGNGLNQAVKQAIVFCTQKNADAVLILPADIPLILPKDINQIIKLSNSELSAVISPSSTNGTNAMLIKPPDLISLNFGPKSFIKHRIEALKKGTVKIYKSKRVTFDIDSPKDLKTLHKTQVNNKSKKYLNQMNIQMRVCCES